MEPLAIIIGICMLILILRTPHGGPLLTKPARIGVGVASLLFATIVTVSVIRTPKRSPEIIAPALGAVMIVGAFVVIAKVLRARRERVRNGLGSPK